MLTRAALIATLTATLTGPALAQDPAADLPPADQYWTDLEDGGAKHDISGATCPGALGDAAMVEVLSYDRASGHLGISCHYVNEVGSRLGLFILRADVPELVGDGQTDAWNESVRKLMARFPDAFPVTIEGLGDDQSVGLYGSVFDAAAVNGVPVQAGLWFAEAGDWVLRGDATFAPTTGGWSAAGMLRQAVIDGKAAIGG